MDLECIKEMIEKNGKENQSMIAMEECAELIQAISKELRGKSDRNHLAEEIADVLICMEYLKSIYDISEEQIETWIEYKQNRVRNHILPNL